MDGSPSKSPGRTFHLPGSPARGPEKVSKKSRGQSGKSPESLQKVSGECFWIFSRLFGDFFGVPGRRFRETFSRLIQHFGPGGPERPEDWFPAFQGTVQEIRIY